MSPPPRRISAELRDTVAVAEGKCPACGADRPDPSVPCPNCGAAPLGPADPGRPNTGEGPRRADAPMQVRSGDLEPYIGLRYISKLFRVLAIVVILMLVAEVITGFSTVGLAAIPRLLGTVTQLLVAAGFLWGAGDLAILLIDVGHDVRAARILLGRQALHQLSERGASATPREGGSRAVDAVKASSSSSSAPRHPEGSG